MEGEIPKSHSEATTEETPKILSEATTEETPAKSGHAYGEPTSTSDLVASAKTVAEAAQLACSNQSDKIDKAKVSEAAEDVLEAAKKYGNLDEKSGVGQYVGKAEGYLHNLHASSDHPVEGGEKKPEADEKKESGGGAAGLMDMAKGFFK
ncbi:hypothetical protein SOVF_035200 [Spinacia oleracea]|uniref:Nodulin-related protein 1 n=1 Tax=Spinacia oleracea TaxID=3562 RepID=A0A9R0K560_SPIOL|nr:nodulin-related protein 1-like [Spinacia oleracea]KNA22276.1 hypothetical protein SOVF_035200 [Spinacia oleracea]